MNLDLFAFDLPEDRIAQYPSSERDSSRLMVLERNGGIAHRSFRDIAALFCAGDLLILNDTKVYPARLLGRKPSGELLDLLLVRKDRNGVWHILSRGHYTGEVAFSDTLTGTVTDGSTLRFSGAYGFDDIRETGTMPLPPYIRRPAEILDRERYQTVYARNEGSIAAPTAGLHFTEKLLKEISGRGVAVRYLTLHVGTGTFRPVRCDTVEAHTMDNEQFLFDASLIDEVKRTKASGKRVIAVGTTSTRALEGFFHGRAELSVHNGTISGATDIFIYPGFTFRAVDCLLTNFHLPRSTPLLLTSAFAGRERLLNAYHEALHRQYRFFSYGDAMLIL